MARKKRSVIPSASSLIVGGDASLKDQVLLSLADLLDPPIREVSLQQLPTYQPPDATAWIEANYIDPVAGNVIRLLDHQRRLLQGIFKLIWAGKINTVVWSEIKKSGKTSVAGAVGSFWAENIESPNEIISIANDQEQAQGRIYAAMIPTLQRLGWDVPEAKPVMSNDRSGTKVKAIGTSYEGEAGGNYGLTLWSELWAYTSERRRRLWEEMTPVPTRKWSVRWVETYAGFLPESDLLWTLYCQAFKDGDENNLLGQRVEGCEDLPIYFMLENKSVVYWSHVPRMPWLTLEFLAMQRKTSRPNAYRRHWQNMWTRSTEAFIEPTQWDDLGRCEPLNEEGDTRSLVLGLDASTHNDCTALSVATWSEETGGPDIVRVWIWQPTEIEGIEKPTIDLDKVEQKLLWLLENFNVLAVYMDPYQLHSIYLAGHEKFDKSGSKKLFVEFAQSSGRIKSDQFFYDSIVAKTLRHTGDLKLREHVLNAVALETDRGFRLDKERTVNKIDGAVASSMAVYGASVRQRPKRKFVSV